MVGDLLFNDKTSRLADGKQVTLLLAQVGSERRKEFRDVKPRKRIIKSVITSK